MSDEFEIDVEKHKRRGSALFYETLRDDILWLRTAPGTAIDEVALAQRFAVSRTPIREALLLLQGDWLVQFLPNGTSIVARLNLCNSGKYFDTLLVLGRTTARAASMPGHQDQADLRKHLEAFRAALTAKDHAAAMLSTLALMQDLTAMTNNIFLKRYFGHSLDSGIRTKLLYYFPNAKPDELMSASDLMSDLIDAVTSRDSEASDAAMQSFLLTEIEVIWRTHQPIVGKDLDFNAHEAAQ